MIYLGPDVKNITLFYFYFFWHRAGCKCTTAAVLEMEIPKNVVGYVPPGLGGTNPVYVDFQEPVAPETVLQCFNLARQMVVFQRSLEQSLLASCTS